MASLKLPTKRIYTLDHSHALGLGAGTKPHSAHQILQQGQLTGAALLRLAAHEQGTQLPKQHQLARLKLLPACHSAPYLLASAGLSVSGAVSGAAAEETASGAAAEEVASGTASGATSAKVGLSTVVKVRSM